MKRSLAVAVFLASCYSLFQYNVVFAAPPFTCSASCHPGGGNIYYDESDDSTSGWSNSATNNNNNNEDKGNRNKPELECSSQNGGIISMSANWSRRSGNGAVVTCYTGHLVVNSCTGQFVGVGDETQVECPEVIPPETGDAANSRRHVVKNICAGYEVSMLGVSCITDFDLEASVAFPAVPLHAKPYPATLVRYDTFVRIGDLPSNSGSASMTFIPWFGGTEQEPARGDWRFVELTITVYPKDPTTGFVYLENIGWLELPIMELYKFQWDQPSHPEGGGGPLAGTVGQLEELPQDMPLLENLMRNPYGIRCTLKWQEWEYMPSIDAEGWVQHAQTVEITPTMVPDLPPQYGADTDRDGTPDAFWNMGAVVLRMNDTFSVDDPIYAHAYSWGEVFYWAVREGQGQISFP